MALFGFITGFRTRVAALAPFSGGKGIGGGAFAPAEPGGGGGLGAPGGGGGGGGPDPGGGGGGGGPPCKNKFNNHLGNIH